MRKISRSGLIKKLDKLVSEKVRELGYCERCGKKSSEVQLQTAHIYSRRYNHLRWDFENVLCLCAGCHFWWHQNPAEAIIWVMEKRDIGYLKELRLNVKPIKTYELQELYNQLSRK